MDMSMEIVHFHFKTLPSTNDWSKENIATFDPKAITLVTADEQSAARGQYGRKWLAPHGLNFYASFSFFIEENQRDPLSLTHVMALSTIRVLEERGLQPRIKWPNDVMVQHKKIAGILCETQLFDGQIGVIIGIGLNINMPDELLKTINQPATSLFSETGRTWDLEEISKSLQTYFAKDLAVFLKQGFTPFLPTFRKYILPS